jgi:hypothetical protein
MANKSGKTEHCGPKKGNGAYWGRKRAAKKESSKARRRQAKQVISLIPENPGKKFAKLEGSEPGLHYIRRRKNRINYNNLNEEELEMFKSFQNDALAPIKNQATLISGLKIAAKNTIKRNKSRFAVECEKLDPMKEIELAEEGMTTNISTSEIIDIMRESRSGRLL